MDKIKVKLPVSGNFRGCAGAGLLSMVEIEAESCTFVDFWSFGGSLEEDVIVMFFMASLSISIVSFLESDVLSSILLFTVLMSDKVLIPNVDAYAPNWPGM